MHHAELFLLAVFGLVIGSFLGLLVVRLPKGEPIIFARSACPHCRRELTAMDLIPVVSWLSQGGRCRTCGAGLSIFYPAVELAAAAIAVAAGWLLTGLWIIFGCIAGWAFLAFAAWRWSSLRSRVRL
jgi:prepilin signal peptidase PulO-like enzyme (type II secretory pathway)